MIEHEAAARGIPGAGEAAARELFERVTAGVRVAESHVRSCYAAGAERHRRPERRRVCHVLLADEPSAQAVAARIAAGEPIGALARELSADAASRACGGDLGELGRGEFAGAFEDAVFAAAAGEVVGPVRTEFGWHVARVERIVPAARAPYAQVREAIRAELQTAERQRAFDVWLAGRIAVLARVEPGWLHPGDPRSADRSHRH